MTAFQYPRDLAERLRAEWGPGWRGVEPEPLPPDDVLVALLEVCFHAGLTLEESRPTLFKAFLGEPETSLAPLVLASLIPLSIQNLRRLVPAAQGMLGLRVGAHPSETMIWGFASDSLGHGLLIEARGPGKLSAGHPLTAWLALEDGHLQNASLGLLGDHFFEVFRESFAEFMTHVPDPIHEPHYQAPFRNWITRLLKKVSDHHHGGAIFVVPEAQAGGSWRACTHIKYPCDYDLLWSEILEEARWEEGKDRHLALVESDSRERRMEDAFSAIGRLTQVDGAVVLTDRFRVLGFGVEVTAAHTIAVVDDRGTGRRVEEFGTRHRSAFRFVAACPQVTAFVCSQDGDLKCVRNIGGTVVMYR